MYVSYVATLTEIYSCMFRVNEGKGWKDSRSRVMELARGFSYTTLNKTRALKEKTNMDNIITDKCVLYCARIQIIIK